MAATDGPFAAAGPASGAHPSPGTCARTRAVQQRRHAETPVNLKRIAKGFAHEDAIVAGLAPASGLFVADQGIKALIFDHRLVRVEPDLAIAAPQGFALRKGEEPAAQASALAVRRDRDIVEQQVFRCGQEHQDPGDGRSFLKDPYRIFRHSRRVVVEHRPGRLADPGDVMTVGAVHDVHNGGNVGSRCGPDVNSSTGAL